MFDSDLSAEAAEVLHRLDAVLDDLLTLPLATCTGGEVLALWRELETRRHRLAPVDHALINEVTERGLPETCGTKNTTALARQLLRISAAEASGRVKAAAALGPRRGISGQALGPIFVPTAQAQAAGTVSEAAARVIIETIDKLPDAVSAERGAELETFLVEQAAILDLDSLRKLGRHTLAVLDPDGTLCDAGYRDRHRDLRLQVRADGSARIEAEATAELTEHLLTILDVTARPAPEQDGAHDLRSSGQRRHDGLLEACKLVLRAGELRSCAGLTTTVIITMNAEAFSTGQGIAVTGHGVVLPAAQPLTWIGGDSRTFPVTLGPQKQVTAYGNAHRLFTEGQRLALIARDQGCSFPGCDTPPQWTQAHHVIEHSAGGPTTVDNGTLLCGFHHRQHEKQGWTCRMINHLPHWIPPAWLDPDTRTPIRNTMHEPELVPS